ncbi:MAG: hypothetical protein ACJ754_00385 [Pyrinomonadaceae bacterium]
MRNPFRDAPYDVLPPPFDHAPAADGVRPNSAVLSLVQGQVRALLESSPNFHELEPAHKQRMYQDLVKIASYTAALVRDDWKISKHLGQTPVLREQTFLAPLAQSAGAAALGDDMAGGRGAGGPLARAAAEEKTASNEFSPRAASQVATITRDTINAIAFPTFVADLIKGTFQAIVNASIQQMEAYGNLLANVAKTVDQFMADNITDNQARDNLVARYPNHFRIEADDKSARVRVLDGADDKAKPDFKTDLGVAEDVSLDDDSAEEKLVPAARRSLAQQRHQLLSTMMLMGINRIVVTSGRIRATMGFHIDARDHGDVATASQFDTAHEVKTSGSFGGGLAGFLGGPSGSIETRHSIAYVTSTKKNSSDEINVNADLTGEVDLKFKSDYFPMERFANPQLMSLIMGNTPNPAANTPVSSAGGDGQKQGGGGGTA